MNSTMNDVEQYLFGSFIARLMSRLSKVTYYACFRFGTLNWCCQRLLPQFEQCNLELGIPRS